MASWYLLIWIFFYSAHPEQLNQQIYNKRNDRIILLTKIIISITLNFFTKIKSPNRSLTIVKQQFFQDYASDAQDI